MEIYGDIQNSHVSIWEYTKYVWKYDTNKEYVWQYKDIQGICLETRKAHTEYIWIYKYIYIYIWNVHVNTRKYRENV